MKPITISFTQDQLRILNAALVELPFKLAAPLIQHINDEIQRRHDEWADGQAPRGAEIQPDANRGD